MSNHKEELIEAFQAKISSIVEKVDRDFYKSLNIHLSRKNLPLKFDFLRGVGNVVIFIEESEDSEFTDQFKIINLYDMFNPGAVVKGIFQTATVHDLITLTLVIPDLEKEVDEFNSNIETQLKAAAKKFKK